MYNRKEDKIGLFTEATYRGKQSPSFYNTVRFDLYKQKAPIVDFKTTKLVRFQPPVKTDLSPTSYKADVSAHKFATSNPNYSQPKEKAKSFINQYIKKKQFVPPPNAYKIEKADKFITIGARKSYK